MGPFLKGATLVAVSSCRGDGVLRAKVEPRDAFKGLNMKIIRCIALVLATLSVVGLSRAQAEGVGEPWGASCRAYHSSRHFANEATMYCLRQHDQKACQERAERFFERCHFTGDYHKMSARIGARMLLVLALSSVRSVHNLDL